MPWIEVKASYSQPSEKAPLDIHEQHPLQAGQTIELSHDRAGLRRKTVAKSTVTIKDDLSADLTIEGSGKTGISVGTAGRFTHRIEEGLPVTRQDMCADNNGKLHGVLWVDEGGERPTPVAGRVGRNFYADDRDEEALQAIRDINAGKGGIILKV